MKFFIENTKKEERIQSKQKSNIVSVVLIKLKKYFSLINYETSRHGNAIIFARALLISVMCW